MNALFFDIRNLCTAHCVCITQHTGTPHICCISFKLFPFSGIMHQCSVVRPPESRWIELTLARSFVRSFLRARRFVDSFWLSCECACESVSKWVWLLFVIVVHRMNSDRKIKFKVIGSIDFIHSCYPCDVIATVRRNSCQFLPRPSPPMRASLRWST